MGHGKLDPGSTSKFHGRFCPWQRGGGVLVQHGPTVCYVSSWTDCGVSAWHFTKKNACAARQGVGRCYDHISWTSTWCGSLDFSFYQFYQLKSFEHDSYRPFDSFMNSNLVRLTSTLQYNGMISFAYVVRGLVYIEFSLEITVFITTIS